MTRRMRGTRMIVQTIVGTSSRSMPITVSTAIWSDVEMPSTRFWSLKIAAYASRLRLPKLPRVENSSIANERQDQVAEHQDEDRDAHAELAARPATAASAALGRATTARRQAPQRQGIARRDGHRTHREARRWTSA